MSGDEVQKLLGGYATGTLTPEERTALFEAALEDQTLFDQLAKEQPLQELLSDSAVRAQLLAALDTAPAPWYRRWASWGLPALVTAAIVAGVAVWRVNENHARPAEVAQVAQPAASSAAPQSAAPPAREEPAEAAPERRTPSPANEAKTKAARDTPPQDKDKGAEARFGAPAGGVVGGIGGILGGAPSAAPSPPPPPVAAPSNTPLLLPQAPTGAGNRFVPAAPPAQKTEATLARALNGTVRDASGAPISGADVQVFAAGTNVRLADTKTGNSGEFFASAGAGSYRVEINANGFLPYRRDAVQADPSGQNPLAVTLQLGAAAETVVVTAADSTVVPQTSQQSQPTPLVYRQQQAQQAQAGAALARTAAIAGLVGARPGASVKVLRQQPDGKPAEVRPDDLRVGDRLILEITPAANGFLTLMESGTTLVNREHVEAGKPFDVPPIPLTAAGVRQFTAFLDATAPAAGGGGGRGGAVRADLEKKKETSANDALSSAPIPIRITVK
jgi:hypothetical protein